jgi:hypothetical protein
MNKTKKIVTIALLMGILIVSVGSVMAKQQYAEKGNEKGDPDRLRDCTCDDTTCEPEGDQEPDRLRDGSCKVTVAGKKQDMIQYQLQKHLKDGSCCDCLCKL